MAAAMALAQLIPVQSQAVQAEREPQAAAVVVEGLPELATVVPAAAKAAKVALARAVAAKPVPVQCRSSLKDIRLQYLQLLFPDAGADGFAPPNPDSGSG